jgi:hypothetical protein
MRGVVTRDEVEVVKHPSTTSSRTGKLVVAQYSCVGILHFVLACVRESSLYIYLLNDMRVAQHHDNYNNQNDRKLYSRIISSVEQDIYHGAMVPCTMPSTKIHPSLKPPTLNSSSHPQDDALHIHHPTIKLPHTTTGS